MTYQAFEFEEEVLVPDDWRVVRSHDIGLAGRVLRLVSDLDFDDDVNSPGGKYRTKSSFNFNFRGKNLLHNPINLPVVWTGGNEFFALLDQ